MLSTTKDLIRAAMRADPSLTPEARRVALSALTSADAGRDAPSLILKPRDAARMLSCTTRTLQNLKTRGILAPVRFPGNAKAHGYRRADIERLVGEA